MQMTQEQQVTTQELCRLNDCITLTMDAIRRVVPQLQALPFGQSLSPYPSQLPSAYGPAGYGIGFSHGQPSFGQMPPMVDPITASYMNSQPLGLRGVFGQHMGLGIPWQNPVGAHNPMHFGGGMGFSSPVGMGYNSPIGYGGYGLGSSPSWQSHYGSPWQAPYVASPVNFGQRVF
jgi:hypothetical protein